MEGLKGIQIAGTVDKLNPESLNAFVKGIDGLTLSQAQAALSTRALTDAQREHILTSAGLLQSMEAITLEEVKQMASSMSLSAQKKEEILTTLQGAYAENEWNIEKLEAIAASGGEAGAIAKSILAKKAENAENMKNIAGKKALIASLKEELAERLALMASNPAVWIAGIAAVSVGLIALQEKFSKSLKECTEELEGYNSEFETAQSSVESLETKLETCTSRLDELQKLADNGTISIIEQEEYERLQKTNDELERNLRIEREKAQLSAIDAAKSADETLNKTVESKYVRGDVASYEGVVLEDQILSVSPKEELEASIEEYNKLQEQIDTLKQSYDNGSISADDYNKQLTDLTDQQTKARTRASEMSDILVESEQAYTNLINTGGVLTSTQKANYNSVLEANQKYNDFLGAINGVNDAFEKLDTAEKAQTIDKTDISFTDILSQVQSLSTGLDKLGKIYTDVKDQGDFDWSSILNNEEFANTFKDMGTVYDNFIQTVSNAPNDMEACQSAFDKLVTTYIYNTKDDNGNNIMDNLTESTKDATVAMLEQMGVANALEVVEAELIKQKEVLAAQETYRAKNATELTEATLSQANAYIMEVECGEAARQALAQLYLQKQLSNDTVISTEEDCQNLIDLARAAGYSFEVTSKLEALKKRLSENPILSNTERDNINNAIKDIFAEAEANMADYDFSFIYEQSSDAAKENTESTLKSIEQTTKEYIDAYMKYMEASLDSSRIDYQTYSGEVAAMLKKMFDEGKISAQDYFSYTQQRLEVEKSVYDKVISAVVNRLDQEIDSYKQKQDAIEERYQSEIDYLDTVIECYNEQKKALQDTNDEIDRQKKLEEALYNLHRAQTQRTHKVYMENTGYIYRADGDAIKDASDELRQAKLDIEIAKLDEAIARVEEQQKALENAMEEEKKALQEIIDRLESYKAQWQSVAKEYETAQAEMMAEQVLGADWEQQILDGRIDKLNDFRNNYISIQQALAAAAWESANEQIKAAKEAEKGAGGSIGSVGGHADEDDDDNDNSSQHYKVVDEYGETLISYRGSNAEEKAEAYKDRLDDAIHDMDKVKVVPYASGTANAKKGIHLVSEKEYGDEIIVKNDKSAVIAKGEQLYPFEGGETVIKASETEKILANTGNLVPLEDITFGKGENTVHFTQEELMQRLYSVMPNYTSMVQVPNIQMPKGDFVMNRNETTPVVQNINLTLPNVTNNSGYERLQRELRQMQIDAMQLAHRR